MSDLYELKVWAEGEARDADGRLLDADGNPTEQAPDGSEGESASMLDGSSQRIIHGESG